MVEREKIPRRRKLKFRHVALAVLAVLVVTFGVFRVAVWARLQARIEAIRAAGYPTTGAELDAWYTIPASADNAADHIMGALTFLNVPDGPETMGLPLFDRTRGLPTRTQSWDEPSRDRVAQLVSDNRKMLDLLHGVVSIPACRYPIDLSQGFAERMSHLAPIRAAVRLLALEVALAGEHDDAERAAQAIVSGYGLTRSLLGEPRVMSQILRAAGDSAVGQALERVINRVGFSDAQLARIETALVASYEPNAMSRAFIGERCLILQTLGDLRAAGMREPSVLLWDVCRALGLMDLAMIRSLDHAATHIEIARLPPHRRRDAVAAAQVRLQAKSKVSFFLNALIPAFGPTVVLELDGIVRFQVTRTAVAVERCRLATGHLPETLDDLTPAFLDAVPTDPFDGQPLRFQKLAPGFVVYSVGPDRTDDGGRERQPTQPGQPGAPYDITFIVER
ncbi:MAG: hypothetical protein JW993_11415 [Sedimentisphaerales bacterium]|nr:hypothetical protein [Sedimentisphaerales bacterium]